MNILRPLPMKRSILLACALVASVFASRDATAAQREIYIARPGAVIIGYLSTPVGPRLHICFGAHQSRNLPSRPVRTSRPSSNTVRGSGGFYTFCIHGLVSLRSRAPFPANPSGVFPTPPPPPLPRPGSAGTNQIPSRVPRIPESQLIFMEAQRVPRQGSTLPAPLPPSSLTTTSTP